MRSDIYSGIISFTPAGNYMSIDILIRSFASKGHGDSTAILIEAIIWPTIFGFTVKRPTRYHDYEVSHAWSIDQKMFEFRVEHLRDCLSRLISYREKYNNELDIKRDRDDNYKVGLRDNIAKLSRRIDFIRSWIAIREFYTHNRSILDTGKIDLHGQSAESARVLVHFFITFFVQRSRFFRQYQYRKALLQRTKQNCTEENLTKALKYPTFYDGFPHLLPSIAPHKTISFIVGLGNHSVDMQGKLEKVVLRVVRDRKMRFIPQRGRSPLVKVVIDEHDIDTGMPVPDHY